mmetsp:Transcript_17217/g.37175  ORF Transcript_17217/g.37175 Transcript_17217/m.37175 type:complete len:221 (-) Transcript_17217:220-882(-)
MLQLLNLINLILQLLLKLLAHDHLLQLPINILLLLQILIVLLLHAIPLPLQIFVSLIRALELALQFLPARFLLGGGVPVGARFRLDGVQLGLELGALSLEPGVFAGGVLLALMGFRESFFRFLAISPFGFHFGAEFALGLLRGIFAVAVKALGGGGSVLRLVQLVREPGGEFLGSREAILSSMGRREFTCGIIVIDVDILFLQWFTLVVAVILLLLLLLE